jgi:hypothetical protein
MFGLHVFFIELYNMIDKTIKIQKRWEAYPTAELQIMTNCFLNKFIVFHFRIITTEEKMNEIIGWESSPEVQVFQLSLDHEVCLCCLFPLKTWKPGRMVTDQRSSQVKIILN